jgi:hypothetical protein
MTAIAVCRACGTEPLKNARFCHGCGSLWLFRLRALLARVHGDDTAYRDYRDRYRDMARTLGYEGHIAWAEAMP